MPTPQLTSTVQEAVDRLWTAARTGVPCAPVRDLIGTDGVDVAYAVQTAVSAKRRAAGARIVGRKIGLTSEAVQRQLGVRQPDFGVLFDDMAYSSGDELPIDRFLQPRVEAEVAFVLGEDLDHGSLDLAQVRSAVAEVRAALEICDSRIAGWDIRFGDTVADNASSGAYVLGDEVLSLSEVQPADVEMRMAVTDQEDSRGNGAACLGDPLLALRWLAVTARGFDSPLLAGHVVLSGALGPMRPVLPGATGTATITGLGTVTAQFSQSTQHDNEER